MQAWCFVTVQERWQGENKASFTGSRALKCRKRPEEILESLDLAQPEGRLIIEVSVVCKTTKSPFVLKSDYIRFLTLIARRLPNQTSSGNFPLCSRNPPQELDGLVMLFHTKV